jgi:Tfp pilus assembly protein FimT
MKIDLQSCPPAHRHLHGSNSRSGVLLVECIVYIAVVTILLGVGMSVFWKCWEGHNALRRNADDIVLALRVGEQWRADIRAATGPILVEKVDDGERLLIPSSAGQIIYTASHGKVTRTSADRDAVVLPTIRGSRMQPDVRRFVTGWRWEIELVSNRKNAGVRPLFAFESAVPPVSPAK